MNAARSQAGSGATAHTQEAGGGNEAKKSETLLEQFIDTIPTLAWCNLPDGSNEFHNQRWHDYTGLSPEEAHGWGWKVAIHPDDLPKLLDQWREVLAAGGPLADGGRVRRHHGQERRGFVPAA